MNGLAATDGSVMLNSLKAEERLTACMRDQRLSRCFQGCALIQATDRCNETGLKRQSSGSGVIALA